jgi:hypothetical protein
MEFVKLISGSRLAVAALLSVASAGAHAAYVFTLSTSSPTWSGYSGTFSATATAPVPVPASAWLLLAGTGGFGLLARKRATV